MGGLGCLEQQGVEERGNLAVEVEQAAAQTAGLVGVGVGLDLDDRDAGAGGEFPHGVGERQVFVFSDEGDGVAALAAAEAMERLARRIDAERRRFLVVERAERLETRAGAFHRDVRADEVLDAGGGEYLLDAFLRDLRHGRAALGRFYGDEKPEKPAIFKKFKQRSHAMPLLQLKAG